MSKAPDGRVRAKVEPEISADCTIERERAYDRVITYRFAYHSSDWGQRKAAMVDVTKSAEADAGVISRDKNCRLSL